VAKKRGRRFGRKPLPTPRRGTLSNVTEIEPGTTQGPGTPSADQVELTWKPQDVTSAPRIGGSDEIARGYAESPAALADKHVFEPLLRWAHPATVAIAGALLLATAASVWIVVQDNGAGKLNTWDDLLWTIEKAGAVFGISVLALGLILGVVSLLQKWLPGRS
jgi:hypothetical protein